MTMTEREQKLYGTNAQIISHSDECTVYRILDESGEAVMTSYHVLPGIELVYNDVHMQSCRVDVSPPENILEINHCREGRIECSVKNEYIYLTEGDLSIHVKDDTCRSSYFPLSHYHGISVTVDLEQPLGCLSCMLDGVSVSAVELARRFCAASGCTVIRAKQCFEHLFSELYHVPEEIRSGYMKVKVLELLLFLSALHPQEQLPPKAFVIKKSQVDKIKCIKRYLSGNLDSRITVKELSAKFDISQTALKTCFKGVFGMSIYSFERELKMQKAALLLRKTDDSVMDIAGLLGYDNASKFAKAFKDVMGASPKDFRKVCDQTEPDIAQMERKEL